MKKLTYTNIFEAIAASPEEASELQTRADLMIVIRDTINEKDDNTEQSGEANIVLTPIHT